MPVLSYPVFGGGATFDGNYDEAEMDTCVQFLREFGTSLLATAKSRKIPQAKLALFSYNYLCLTRIGADLHFLFVDTTGENFIQFYDLEKDGFLDEAQLRHELEATIGPVAFSFHLLPEQIVNKDSEVINRLVELGLHNTGPAELVVPGDPQVFISYTHESESHKNWVLQLATRLRANSVDVLLDQWNRLGSNLINFMEQGLSRSHRVICICSDSYVVKANQGSGGAGYEKQIMAAELLKDQNTDWVIPLIRNNAEKKVPVFLSGKLYIDFNDNKNYESRYTELLRDLLNEPLLPIPPLGENPFRNIANYQAQSFIPANEKYVSPALKGQVSFDYSNNNGKYSIGHDELLFELSFHKSSATSIQLTNRTASIKAIAVAKNIAEITELNDVRQLDFSSDYRRPKLSQIAVLQNKNGFYAAIKILAIQDDTRGAADDLVEFDYYIQSNGSPDFSNGV